MDLNADQVSLLREWNERLPKPVSIRLLQTTD